MTNPNGETARATPRSARVWLAIAGVSGALAVAAGAYGAHGMDAAPEHLRDSFETAVRYHMWHTLALTGVAWLATRGGGLVALLAGIAFTAGIVMFSGTLYAFAVTEALPVTGLAPAGGATLMAGWVLLAVAGFRVR